MRPKVSVIIPLYNKEQWIRESIESVLNQSFTDFEIVVIDDGSIDRGADIVKSIKDKRVRLFRQKNSGVSTARNRGIELSRGEYITFLDADDIYKKEHLIYLIEGFKRFKDIDFVANKIIEADKIEYKEFDFLDELSKNRFWIHIGSIMIKSKLLREYPNLRFEENISIGEDINFLIKLSCIAKGVVCSYRGLEYRRVDMGSAMQKENKRVLFLPKYLQSISKSSCKSHQYKKLMRFILIEYMKKAYQNRKESLNIDELRNRDAGGDFRLAIWTVIPYLIVRYTPDFIFYIYTKLKKRKDY